MNKAIVVFIYILFNQDAYASNLDFCTHWYSRGFPQILHIQNQRYVLMSDTINYKSSLESGIGANKTVQYRQEQNPEYICRVTAYEEGDFSAIILVQNNLDWNVTKDVDVTS